jgi:hypothetical protein
MKRCKEQTYNLPSKKRIESVATYINKNMLA